MQKLYRELWPTAKEGWQENEKRNNMLAEQWANSMALYEKQILNPEARQMITINCCKGRYDRQLMGGRPQCELKWDL